MSNTISKKNQKKKCFYCDKEATNITIDDEGVMFYLCERHLKLFNALYPKEAYKKRQNEYE